MRSFLSAMVLAATFGLLVPDKHPLSAAESLRAAPAAASAPAYEAPAFTPAQPVGDASGLGWLLALGFAGAVMARRLGQG
jgi:hypothetical protein